MDQPRAPRKTAQTQEQRRTRPLTLLVLAPFALGFLVAGCETIEDTTDYIGDLFSYVEDDDEIFGDGAVPGADQAYRSLHEVPGEAPVVSNAAERDAVTASLVADREKARHTAAILRAGDGVGEGQLRAVYQPAQKEDASPPDGV